MGATVATVTNRANLCIFPCIRVKKNDEGKEILRFLTIDLNRLNWSIFILIEESSGILSF